MPIGEHIITYNRYEPISNLIDLTTGNRTTKPATLKEVNNEDLPTFKKKHDKIPNCIYSTPQKLALTSPTGGGRSVGIVRSRTKATEFSLYTRHLTYKTSMIQTVSKSNQRYVEI